MSSTSNPTPDNPDAVLTARTDERLAHVYEQIALADEQLARVTEQLSKMEHDPVPHPSVVSGPRPSHDRPALRGLVGLLLAACIGGVAFAAQTSHGEAARLIVAQWAPYLNSAASPWLAKPGNSAQASASTPQLASAGCNCCATGILGSGPGARCRARVCAHVPGADAIAAVHGARYRHRGAGGRTAQGEPGTNGRRQCQRDRAAKGEPGTDTPCRQASREAVRAGTAAEDSGALAPTSGQRHGQAPAEAAAASQSASAAGAIAAKAAIADIGGRP